MRPAITRIKVTMAALLVVTSLAAGAQQAPNVPRIGFLVGAVTEGAPGPEAFRQGLRSFGYVESQNIVIEWRWARGDAAQLPGLAEDLVRRKVALIVANSSAPAQAAHAATKSIPIVMVYPPDPVALGLVDSLARPGRNVTGLTSQTAELDGKRLQLLQELVPNLSRVAFLSDPGLPGVRQRVKDAETAAAALGLRIHFHEAAKPGDFAGAFAAMGKERNGAVLYTGSTMHFAHRVRIAEYALKNRLPSVCGLPEYVESGCLVAYSASTTELWRRAAYFVDRILKGAQPADLPVEQPTKFELVVNLKTAKALGLPIKPSLLLRADQVIE